MKGYFLTFTFLLSLLAKAQDEHPIEQWVRSKMQNAITTADMVQPHETAYQHWDHLMNIVYQELEKGMSPATFEALRKSQRAWPAFRDAEIETINSLYYRDFQGTMWYPVAAAKRKQVVRRRVLELLDMYEEISYQSLEGDLPPIIGEWVSQTDGSMIAIREDLTIISRGSDRDPGYFFYFITGSCDESNPSADKQYLHKTKPGSSGIVLCYEITQEREDLFKLTDSSGRVTSYQRKQ